MMNQDNNHQSDLDLLRNVFILGILVAVIVFITHTIWVIISSISRFIWKMVVNITYLATYPFRQLCRLLAYLAVLVYYYSIACIKFTLSMILLTLGLFFKLLGIALFVWPWKLIVCSTKKLLYLLRLLFNKPIHF